MTQAQEQRLRVELQTWRELADEINAGNREHKRSEVIVLRDCAAQIEALLDAGEQPAPLSLMTCQYTPLDEPCGDEIHCDPYSPSGWSHCTIRKPSINHSGSCHWASPIKYGLGEAETERILQQRVSPLER